MENKTLLAVFDEIDPAAEAVDVLRAIGIQEESINIISGFPITEAMFGRKPQKSHVPMLSMGGAIAGLMIGLIFAVWTPISYPLNVGGQALVAGPPTIIVIFEMTMLGMLLSTFLGVFLDSKFPNLKPMEYVPEISDGKIAILVDCEGFDLSDVQKQMETAGADPVRKAEARHL